MWEKKFEEVTKTFPKTKSLIQIISIQILFSALKAMKNVTFKGLKKKIKLSINPMNPATSVARVDFSWEIKKTLNSVYNMVCQSKIRA